MEQILELNFLKVLPSLHYSNKLSDCFERLGCQFLVTNPDGIFVKLFMSVMVFQDPEIFAHGVVLHKQFMMLDQII